VTVYVDDWRQWARVGPIETRWSHLTADDAEELHAFAEQLGLRRAWFQDHHRDPTRHHYDLSDPARERAIESGAVAVTWREGARLRRIRREQAGRK
jgi:alkanesulfonate monooxygenase SsuD/methylene tetrahydromethanopterin reductase-like flavin-dependent oxidoreductase (luciferase family)